MPKIDVTSLPGLEDAKGLYGSLNASDTNAVIGGPIVDIMVYIYETNPPPPPSGPAA